MVGNLYLREVLGDPLVDGGDDSASMVGAEGSPEPMASVIGMQGFKIPWVPVGLLKAKKQFLIEQGAEPLHGFLDSIGGPCVPVLGAVEKGVAIPGGDAPLVEFGWKSGNPSCSFQDNFSKLFPRVGIGSATVKLAAGWRPPPPPSNFALHCGRCRTG